MAYAVTEINSHYDGILEEHIFLHCPGFAEERKNVEKSLELECS